MPDITMCINKNCPLRVRCYRYRAVPSNRQSFCKFEPEIRQTEPILVATCYEFWDIDNKLLVSLEEADGRYNTTEKEEK